jgi:hypothetical protein
MRVIQAILVNRYNTGRLLPVGQAIDLYIDGPGLHSKIAAWRPVAYCDRRYFFILEGNIKTSEVEI